MTGVVTSVTVVARNHRPAHRAHTVSRRSALVAAGLVVTVVVAFGATAPFGLSQARGATEPLVLEVDTLQAGTPDANPGDGVCATSAANGGKCSLRAAIEEANKTSDPNREVRIEVAEGVSGTIEMDSSKYSTQNMTTKTPAYGNDYGAYFWITRTMTIDLDNRVHTKADSTLYSAAAFFVNGPNVRLLNFTDIFSNKSSFVFGPNSDGSTLDGGSSLNLHDNQPEAFIRVRPGADDITISNYTIGRTNGGATYDGMIRLSKSSDPDNLKDPIKNLTISNVTFDNTAASTKCAAPSSSSPTNGGGCSDHGIKAYGDTVLTNLVVEHSTFKNFPANRNAIDLHGMATTSSFVISDNVFTNIKTGESGSDATIFLGDADTHTGSKLIQRNVFDNAGVTGQYYAIRWKGGASSGATTASNLFIEDNYFDGYGAQTVLLNGTGAATVRRNRFGPNTASQATTSNEETIGKTTGNNAANAYGAMVMNYDRTANRRILTWYPESTEITDSCQLRVGVKAPTSLDSYNLPTAPVALDFYYTTNRTAEIYLGSVASVTQNSVVTVPGLPPAAGWIRIQTQGKGPNADQTESSQYSRTVPVGDPGICGDPAMTTSLRAWVGVDSAADSHDQVIATGQEIDPDGRVASDQPVWFTYTVENTGWPTLRDVVVRDTEKNPVCFIPEIKRGQTDGCWRRFV